MADKERGKNPGMETDRLKEEQLKAKIRKKVDKKMDKRYGKQDEGA